MQDGDADDNAASIEGVNAGADRILTRTDRRVHPIVIYPFTHPRDTAHLSTLYSFLDKLCGGDGRYFRPITVLNRQTVDRVASAKMSLAKAKEAREAFQEFLDTVIEPRSEVRKVWCVDTCQMWLTGLGRAFDRNDALAAVYWLIPGDFNYASAEGEKVLSLIESIPAYVYEERDVDLALGEIKVPLNSAKQLIDTYGTYGLLYNWFPNEAQGIRLITDKPRSEFLAISDSYLKYVLSKRWYAYEQTIVLLLQAMGGGQPIRGIRKVELGAIEDEEQGRSRLEGAMQQVERTERVLKLFWRERHHDDRSWQEDFRRLDMQSEQVRAAAMIIFEQILA
jgi:hypothetical protein